MSTFAEVDDYFYEHFNGKFSLIKETSGKYYFDADEMNITEMDGLYLNVPLKKSTLEKEGYPESAPIVSIKKMKYRAEHADEVMEAQRKQERHERVERAKARADANQIQVSIQVDGHDAVGINPFYESLEPKFRYASKESYINPLGLKIKGVTY